MRILITGWTGNTGSKILARAARRWPDGFFVGVTRQKDTLPPADLSDRFHVAVAPLEDETTLEKAAFGFGETPAYDLVLHTAHVRFTPPILRLAQRCGVPRVLLIHTTGMYSQYREYGAHYREIDDAVTAQVGSGPCWTILRPTMIYGNSRDHNLHKMIHAISRLPIFPLFGNGGATFQPVHVDDVAQAAMTVLETPACRWRAYDLSGGTVATYKEMIALISAHLNRRPLLLPIPLPAALALASLGERVRPGGVGVSREQIRRLSENKAFSHTDAARDFGFSPRSLSDGLAEEITLMRREGLLPLTKAGSGSPGTAAAE